MKNAKWNIDWTFVVTLVGVIVLCILHSVEVDSIKKDLSESVAEFKNYKQEIEERRNNFIGEVYTDDGFYKFQKNEIVERHHDFLKIRYTVVNGMYFGYNENDGFWVNKNNVFYYDNIYDSKREEIKKNNPIKIKGETVWHFI